MNRIEDIEQPQRGHDSRGQNFEIEEGLVGASNQLEGHDLGGQHLEAEEGQVGPEQQGVHDLGGQNLEAEEGPIVQMDINDENNANGA